MRAVTKLLAFALIAAVAGGAAEAAKKKRTKRAAPAVTTDSSGTPVIMNGLPDNYSIMREEPGTRPAKSRTEPKTGETRPMRRAVGSSTYVPPPVPSPMAGGPSPQDILLSGPRINNPPVQHNNSFSDRVTQCNHSFPLNAGIGNNPTDRSAYVRQCAN